MAIEPLTLGTFAGLSKIFDYFRPTKSPYLIAISTVTICFWFARVSTQELDMGKVHLLMIPMILFLIIFSIVPIIFYFSKRQIVPEDGNNVEFIEQFKFSRSIFISIILICMYNIIVESVINWVFITSYVVILVNLVVFSGYLLVREIKEDEYLNQNLIQIALINSLLMIVLTMYAPKVNLDDQRFSTDCSTRIVFEYKNVQETSSEALDSDEVQFTKDSAIISTCSLTEKQKVDFLNSIDIESYPEAKIVSVSDPIERFSYQATLFIVSLFLLFMYFIFWIYIMHSIIKIKIVG